MIGIGHERQNRVALCGSNPQDVEEADDAYYFRVTVKAARQWWQLGKKHETGL